MEIKQSDVIEALRAIDDACLKCEKHCDSCYIAVALRSISILRKKEEGEHARKNGMGGQLCDF